VGLWFILGSALLCSAYAEPVSQVCFQEMCFRVERAQTASEQARGLMGRRTLESDEGMLFLYDAESHLVMHMRHMHIPIDMVWLDQNREVVHIHKDVPICRSDRCPRYGADRPAQYVLELKAGTAERIGLRPGARAEFL
jgi:uncharacterized membrane protein (UPF0127 family)